MHTPRIIAVVVVSFVALPLAAQVPVVRGAIDSAQIAGAMSFGLRAMQPAQFVLDHRTDLALTSEQLSQLETIAAAQRDSAAVRQRRMMDEVREDVRRRTTRPMTMTWSGPLDEDAIRAETARQSARQAESMINLTRDRHAVGAVLTPAQLAMLPRLEGREMMQRMMTRPAPDAGAQGDHPYFEFQVEKQVVGLPGVTPVYPPALRAAAVEGEVLAQFVVDTAGRFEPGSFKVLKSSHDLFTQAVRDALPEMRFAPAEIGGRKVRQLVQQPFTFSPGKS